jgi:hypothetical protein
MPTIPSSTTTKAPKLEAKLDTKGDAPGSVATEPVDVAPQREPGSKYEQKGKTLFMRLLDRWGTNSPKNDAQREQDLQYRAERKAAFDAEMPSLAKSDKPFDDVLRRAHKLLNVEKHFPLSLRISALVMGNTLDAGQYRTGPNRAGDYRAPSSHDVPALMKDFGKAMGRLLPQANDADALLVAGWALTVMIRIHPFADGNGRTARAAMNLVLANSGHRTVDFPSDSEGIYKQSPVWARLKDHMRGFTKELGWTMKDGAIPPHGYAEKVAGLLTSEIEAVSIESLRGRADVKAIADALSHAREHGFTG